MRAVELLVAGQSVKEVAFAVGYQDSGTLVALFRQHIRPNAQGLEHRCGFDGELATRVELIKKLSPVRVVANRKTRLYSCRRDASGSMVVAFRAGR